jgi:hypothetical protein
MMTGKVYLFNFNPQPRKAAKGLQLGVCYFALQTLQALDKINRQNNSTKPLLVAGVVN